MGKLIEKLEKASEGRAQPLGFGPAATTARVLPMLIIAEIPGAGPAETQKAIEAGADAVLVDLGSGQRDLLLERFRGIDLGAPWGVYLDMATRQDLTVLSDAGCDFVVFATENTPASLLNDEKADKILRIDMSMDEFLARSIARLDVDAVLIDLNAGPPLTVSQLMVLGRLVGAAGKHAIMHVPLASPPEDIEVLWGLGVRGLVAEFSGEKPEESLAALRRAIEKLPRAKKRRGDKLAARVPAPAQPPAAEPEEEEEGE